MLNLYSLVFPITGHLIATRRDMNFAGFQTKAKATIFDLARHIF